MSHASGGENPRRIVGSFVLIPVLTGIFVTAVLASNLIHRQSRDTATYRYYSADRTAMVAAERWVISAERDSLVPWVASLRAPTDSLVVRVDSGVSHAIASLTDSLLRSEWRSLGAHQAGVRVAAVIALDTMRNAGALKRPHERLPRYIMPWALDGRTCVAVFHITRELLTDPALLGRGALSNGNTHVSLGPCAFVTALGIPGKGARAWLANVGNSHAMIANWWLPHASSSTQPPNAGSAREAVDSTSNAIRLAAYEDRIAEGLRSPNIAACRQGRDSSCMAVIDPTSPVTTGNTRYVLIAAERLTPPPGVLMPESRAFQASTYGALLSDLVRDIGPDRAGVAWRSDAPFVQSLAAAASTSPAELGAAWVRTNVPPVERSDISLSAAAIATSVLLALLLLWLALATTRSRERT